MSTQRAFPTEIEERIEILHRAGEASTVSAIADQHLVRSCSPDSPALTVLLLARTRALVPIVRVQPPRAAPAPPGPSSGGSPHTKAPPRRTAQESSHTRCRPLRRQAPRRSRGAQHTNLRYLSPICNDLITLTGVGRGGLCTACMYVHLFNSPRFIRKRICYTSMHTRFHGVPALFPITQAGCVIVYLGKAALRQLFGCTV